MAATLAACGGGDGSGPQGSDDAPEWTEQAPDGKENASEVADAVPEGLWNLSGADGDLDLLVLEDGEVWGLGEESAVYGSTVGEGDGKFSGTVQLFESCDDPQFGSYSGNFSPNGEIEVTAQLGDGRYDEFSGTYNDLYDQPTVSLQQLAGYYTGQAYSFSWDEADYMLDIQGNGNVLFTQSDNPGCTASGKIAPRASGKNVFDLSVIFKGNSCLLRDGEQINGVALADGQEIVAMGINLCETDGLVYSGQKADEAPLADPADGDEPADT